MTSSRAARIARARRLLALYLLVARVKGVRFISRAALVVVTAVVVLTLDLATGSRWLAEPAEATASAPAPVSAECQPRPGDLFHPCATLDTTHVQDMRTPDERDHQENAAEHGDCAAKGMVTAEDYSCMEHEAGTAIPLTDELCLRLGLPANQHGQCITGTSADVVAISAPDEAQHDGVDALVRAGYSGEAGDGLSAVYAPVGAVVADEAGTWTVTVDGLARCEHGAERRCTGQEQLG